MWIWVVWNSDVLHWPCWYDHVIYNISCITSIHKSSSMASSDAHFPFSLEIVGHPHTFRLLFFKYYVFRHSTFWCTVFCILCSLNRSIWFSDVMQLGRKLFSVSVQDFRLEGHYREITRRIMCRKLFDLQTSVYNYNNTWK